MVAAGRRLGRSTGLGPVLSPGCVLSVDSSESILADNFVAELGRHEWPAAGGGRCCLAAAGAGVQHFASCGRSSAWYVQGCSCDRVRVEFRVAVDPGRGLVTLKFF